MGMAVKPAAISTFIPSITIRSVRNSNAAAPSSRPPEPTRRRSVRRSSDQGSLQDTVQQQKPRKKLPTKKRKTGETRQKTDEAATGSVTSPTSAGTKTLNKTNTLYGNRDRKLRQNYSTAKGSKENRKENPNLVHGYQRCSAGE